MPKIIRIAIDTNLWVSHVFNQFQSHLNAILEDKDVEIITSPELTRELFAVLNRPKFQDKISPQLIVAFRILYEQSTLNVEVTSKVTDSRDAKDNYLLGLALDAKLDFLLTGDSDLLILDPYGQTRIMKIADFVAAQY